MANGGGSPHKRGKRKQGDANTSSAQKQRTQKSEPRSGKSAKVSA